MPFVFGFYLFLIYLGQTFPVGLVLKAIIFLAPPALPILIYSVLVKSSLALFLFSLSVPTRYDVCGFHDDRSPLPTPGD